MTLRVTKMVSEEPEEKSKHCLIEPSNTFKLHWDVLMTVILLYSCIATPVQIALWEELVGAGLVINTVVDFVFFVDIIIIFNSAMIDDDLMIIRNRFQITMDYL